MLWKTTVLIGQRDVVVLLWLIQRLLWHLAARYSAVSEQYGHELGAVVVSGQEVEDGVQAAVEAGQRPCDLVGKVDDIEGFTRDLQHAGGIVEGPRDVEGHEAHGEDHEHHHDELDGLVTGGGGLPGGRQATAGPAEGSRHLAVAHHDDQEGDAEQEHHDG